MNILFDPQGTFTRIALDGRLDAAGTAEVESAFSAHCSTKPNVIVDLTKVPFMASIGIRMLVAGAKAQTAIGGKMVLLNPDEMARRILKTTGIEHLIKVYDSLQDAKAAVAAK